jgi:hypothetical protein
MTFRNRLFWHNGKSRSWSQRPSFLITSAANRGRTYADGQPTSTRGGSGELLRAKSPHSVQRFTYLGLIPVFFVAALAPARGRSQRTLFWAAAILTLAGLGVAGYQTYLQMFPAPLVARCSASLSYMLDNRAVSEVLGQLLHATGDCSDTSFKVLGLTMAQASPLMFLALRCRLPWSCGDNLSLHRRRPLNLQAFIRSR